MTCSKHKYSSKHQARREVRGMGQSVRAYFCEDCKWWHVTKQRVKEK